MPVVASIRREVQRLRLPDRRRLLDGPIERCGHCMLLWPADEMVEELREDGLIRVCPAGSSPSTAIDYTTSVRDQVAADVERFVPLPNISLAPMERTIPPTVVSINDLAENPVFNGNPLRVERGTTGALVLHGRSFPPNPAALISFPTGVVTDFSATVDAARLTVELNFDVSALAIPAVYSVAFYEGYLRNVLLVR